MKGSINSLEDLLKAGINEAESLIIVNKESRQSSNEEQALEDCKTILAVQYIFRHETIVLII
jgi:potassium channel subfamily T member 1